MANIEERCSSLYLKLVSLNPGCTLKSLRDILKILVPSTMQCTDDVLLICILETCMVIMNQCHPNKINLKNPVSRQHAKPIKSDSLGMGPGHWYFSKSPQVTLMCSKVENH